LQWRILVPSASAPPSTGTPGLWRRKSSVGAVDAQGLGLTHPMTWIDERLFGWSRSAKRGTSAWAGTHDEPSRAGTPEDSEEEDAGDYDNVIGFIPGHDDSRPGSRSRSRTSSYADLQRLRFSATSPISSTQSSSMTSPSAELDGLKFHTGQGHRERRPSLSDDVPVRRLAAVDRQEPFVEATSIINEEMRQAKNR